MDEYTIVEQGIQVTVCHGELSHLSKMT
ncbi:UNVERIFIED_CONTAM: hypothetical protein B566_EDAN017741, partial [Ephemera danica]